METRKNGITRFGLRNFKAFRYLEDIELKPLTLLVGANSSGKSSVFQSLLLLKQSLLAGSGGSQFKFDGDWVKLGNFPSVVSDFDVSRRIEYRFLIAAEVPTSVLVPAPNGSLPEQATMSVQVRLSMAQLAPDQPAVMEDFWIQLEAPEIFIDEPELHLHLDSSTARLNDATIDVIRSPNALVRDKFLPNFQLLDLASNGTVRQLGWRQLRGYDVSFEILRQKLSWGLDYLGPVRADPRPFYPVSEEPEIGARGEGAIPYLLKSKTDVIHYCPGPSEEPRAGTLFEAMNHWLARMRVTPGLTIDPVESIAYTAAVRTPLVKSRPVNLAQVGFGISQLLPVLLQGLRNPRDGITLFEQPESQLHPRLQGELGDFFLSCARAGKTLMVETHSDHLVHRIRRRIAEDPTGQLSDMVQILFVHPGNEENPGSYVEPLRVGPDGAIENWPDDFLQDAADEAWAILRARRARDKQAMP